MTLSINKWVLLTFSLLFSVNALAEKMPIDPRAKATQLSAKVTDFSVALTWQLPKQHSFSKALVYRKAYALPLYRNKQTKGGVDLGEKLAELDIKQQRFGDAELKKHTRYYYRVVLQDEQGQKSLPSLPVIVMLKDVEAPLKVTTLKANINNETQLTLRWTASESNDVQSYRVLRSRQNERPVMVKSVRVEDDSNHLYSTQITQRKNVGIAYLYAVAAVDAAGNSSVLSPFVKVRLSDHKAPRSPLLLKAKQIDESIALSWRHNSEDDLKGYKVYRRLDNSHADFVPLHQAVLTKTHFIDSDIKTLTQYRYRVSAVDDFGNESQETKGILVRTQALKQSLMVPKNVQLKTTKTGFPRLSWQTNNPVVVYRSDGDAYQLISPILNKKYYLDDSIEQGKAYHYELKAISPVGHFSKASDTVLWTGAKQ